MADGANGVPQGHRLMTRDRFVNGRVKRCDLSVVLCNSWDTLLPV
jgi:hypothetical protein